MPIYHKDVIVHAKPGAPLPRILTLESDGEPLDPAASWDLAYEIKKETGSFAEPNQNEYPFTNPALNDTLESAAAACNTNNDFEAGWPHPPAKSIWHLSDSHSGLKTARDSV